MATLERKLNREALVAAVEAALTPGRGDPVASTEAAIRAYLDAAPDKLDDAYGALAQLVDVAAQLVDVAEDMLPYVAAHFREKWGYEGEIAAAKTALARLRSEESSGEATR